MAVPPATATEQPTPAGSPAGQRMLAIVQKEYGTADVLHVTEIERPVIEAGEVLVHVRAAGLDRGTWHLMAGLPYAARLVAGLRAPKNPVPGLDVAGAVVAVGSEVTRFQPGDEVFGISKGSFAEFAAAREDKLARKPSNLTFEQAAAVPVSGMTALRGLSDVGRLQAGQKVLIIGASGGVGTYAVQIAKALGAEVTGVCSTSKLDLVRSIGADHVVDYTQDDFANGDKQYDLILDVGGNSALSRLRRALTPHGALVIAGGEGGGDWIGMGRQLRALALSPFVGQRLTTFGPREHHTILERLTELIENGHLMPVIEQTYPLNEMPDAMRHLVAGHARGKLVIAVDPRQAEPEPTGGAGSSANGTD
jgi:NADPH:quinone reductase-like Zn-dependent oxidoreductase